MKTTQLLTVQQLSPDLQSAQNPLPHLSASGSRENHETVRHILVGSSGAVRQTIHLLHSLHYAETVLWSPITTIEDSLVITPAQGEAMSLLRKQV